MIRFFFLVKGVRHSFEVSNALPIACQKWRGRFTNLAKMITDFTAADIFFGLDKSRVFCIFVVKCFRLVQTVMEINPPAAPIYARSGGFFFFLNVIDVRCRFFFSPHNTQRIDANIDALPFRLRLCSWQLMDLTLTTSLPCFFFVRRSQMLLTQWDFCAVLRMTTW